MAKLKLTKLIILLDIRVCHPPQKLKQPKISSKQRNKTLLGTFLYTKDKAKIVHGQRDFESVFKNNLRYLYFINQFLGCGTSSSCIGNEIRNNDTESFGREK